MMREGDLGVRVKTPYQQYDVGRIIFPPMLLREALIKRGLVEAVTPEDGKTKKKGAK